MLAILISLPRRASPAQLLVVSYLFAILLGSGLLMTPLASQSEPLNWDDALFMATSAQCVTGLATVDPGTRLSLFGQLVLLVLIQLGGLGVTTFSVYLFIYLRIGLGAAGRWILNETLLHSPIGSLQDMVHGIVVMTLWIELAGAVLLSFAFVPRLGLVQGVYSAVFHSISAFCNAGFSLFPDSLMGFQSDPLVNLTVMALILLGGIGFLVIQEVLAWGRAYRAGQRRIPFSLHSKIVLTTSAILIVVGALAIAWLEKNAALAGMGLGAKFWVSLFQSVTARTAGFNTIDLALLREPTLFFIIILMFVGASPGSAGGGIKTTSLALFYAIVVNRFKGSPHTTLFYRTIPEEAVNKAMSQVLMALTLICLALFALLSAQEWDLQHEFARGFLSYTFEAFSAFGTVGLSMGATGKLNEGGKVILIILMFVGRVGLLSLAFAVAGRRKPYAPRYAEENIMIG